MTTALIITGALLTTFGAIGLQFPDFAVDEWYEYVVPLVVALAGGALLAFGLGFNWTTLAWWLGGIIFTRLAISLSEGQESINQVDGESTHTPSDY